MERDASANDLAATQYGLLRRDQLVVLGFTPSAIRHRLRVGRWIAVTPRVVRLAGVPRSEPHLAMAATLDVPGARVCLDAAAAAWGLPGYRLLPLHLLRLNDGQHPACPLAMLHTTRHLPDEHLALWNGIPITTPVRTLFDLAPHVHPLRLARLVDTAWSKRLVSGALLHTTLEDHAARGRDGIRVMRAILEERGAGYRPPDSNLEARVQQLARSVGITTLRRQVVVGHHQRIGRVDFVDADVPLIVEVDSETFHGSVVDQENDRRRDEFLLAAGYVIERVTEFDAWHRPKDVCQGLAAARAAAFAKLGR